METYEIPDWLATLAEDRGYVLELTSLELPCGSQRPFWLALDLCDHTFVLSSLEWKSPNDAQMYIEDSSGPSGPGYIGDSLDFSLLTETEPKS